MHTDKDVSQGTQMAHWKQMAVTKYTINNRAEEEVEICLTVIKFRSNTQTFTYVSQRESLNQIWFNFKTPNGEYTTPVQKYDVDPKGKCHKLKSVHFFERRRKRKGHSHSTLKAVPVYSIPPGSIEPN